MWTGSGVRSNRFSIARPEAQLALDVLRGASLRLRIGIRTDAGSEHGIVARSPTADRFRFYIARQFRPVRIATKGASLRLR